jgi:hypothetical protein
MKIPLNDMEETVVSIGLKEVKEVCEILFALSFFILSNIYYNI